MTSPGDDPDIIDQGEAEARRLRNVLSGRGYWRGGGNRTRGGCVVMVAVFLGSAALIATYVF